MECPGESLQGADTTFPFFNEGSERKENSRLNFCKTLTKTDKNDLLIWGLLIKYNTSFILNESKYKETFLFAYDYKLDKLEGIAIQVYNEINSLEKLSCSCQRLEL